MASFILLSRYGTRDREIVKSCDLFLLLWLFCIAHIRYDVEEVDIESPGDAPSGRIDFWQRGQELC